MNLVTSIALALLGGIFAALAAFGGIRAAWRGLGRRRGVSAALAALAAACTILAQKTSISFDRLISDAGSYATNDVLHVAATNAAAYAMYDFTDSNLLVYRRERGLTNAADWVECLPRRKYGDLPADWHVPDATNYDYLVAVDYVPPSPVHTNGVFELRGFVVPSAASGTRSAAFATSSAKLKHGDFWRWPTNAVGSWSSPSTEWSNLQTWPTIYRSFAWNGYSNQRSYDVFSNSVDTIASIYSGGYCAAVFYDLPPGDYALSFISSRANGDIGVMHYARTEGGRYKWASINQFRYTTFHASIRFTASDDERIGFSFRGQASNGAQTIFSDIHLVKVDE